MKFKLICANLTAIAMACMSACVQAAPLTIVNNTNEDSTTVTNNRVCSATLPGGGGVTKAHSTNVVSDGKIKIACFHNQENCKADVYMTPNCTGPIVATVIFSVKSGIKSISMTGNGYDLQGSGFTVEMNGGPA